MATSGRRVGTSQAQRLRAEPARVLIKSLEPRDNIEQLVRGVLKVQAPDRVVIVLVISLQLPLIVELVVARRGMARPRRRRPTRRA